MAIKLAEIFTEIGVRDDKHKRGIASAKADMNSLAKTSAITSAAIAASAIYASRYMIRAAETVIEKAVIQLEAERKLEAVLKATGNAAGISQKQMMAHAAELQKIAGVGDEVIISSQAMLATFKEIKGDQFREATEAALDMSLIMGTDMKQAALQLGKALNEPITGMTALRRSGISFTKEQKEQISTLAQTNRLAEAQAIILGEVKREVGGAAREVQRSAIGPWRIFNNRLGDIQEKMGLQILVSSREFSNILNTKLTPALEKSADAGGELNKMIDEAVRGFIELIKIGEVLAEFTGLKQLIQVGQFTKGVTLGAAESVGTFLGENTGFGGAAGRSVRTRSEFDAIRESREGLRLHPDTIKQINSAIGK